MNKMMHILLIGSLLMVEQSIISMQQQSPVEMVTIITSDNQQVAIPVTIAHRSALIARTLKFNKDQGQPNKPIVFGVGDEVDVAGEVDKEKLDIALELMQLLAQQDIKAIKATLDNYDINSIITIGNTAAYLQIPLLERIIAKIIADYILQIELNQDQITTFMTMFRPDLEHLIKNYLLAATLPYFVYNNPKVIELLDPESYNLTQAGYIRALVFSPDSKTIATGPFDKIAKLWDVTTGEFKRGFFGHKKMIKALALSPDGKTLATGSRDKTAKLWDIATGNLKATLNGDNGHTSDVTVLAFSPNSKILATASDDKTIKLWQVETGNLKTTLPGHKGFITALAFSPDGTMLATGSEDEKARLWDVAAGTLIKEFSTGFSEDIGIITLSFSPDGKTLAIGFSDGMARLWNVQTGKLMKTLSGHQGNIITSAFSPNGRMLATGSDDEKVILWNVVDNLITILSGHNGDVIAVSFSPDGKMLATGSYDKTAKLWDVATGNLITTLKHPDDITTLAFSPDGTVLATGSRDNRARLFHFPKDILQTINNISFQQALLIAAAYQAAQKNKKLEISEIGVLASAYVSLPAAIMAMISPYIQIVSFVQQQEQDKQ